MNDDFLNSYNALTINEIEKNAPPLLTIRLFASEENFFCKYVNVGHVSGV